MTSYLKWRVVGVTCTLVGKSVSYIPITTNLTLTPSNSMMQNVLVIEIFLENLYQSNFFNKQIIIKSSLHPKIERTGSFIATEAISLDTCKYHCQFCSVMSTYMTTQILTAMRIYTCRLGEKLIKSIHIDYFISLCLKY